MLFFQPVTMEKESSQVRVVERIFRLRALGLGLGFFAVAGVLYENSAHAVTWIVLVAYAFVWPLFARRTALDSPDPERAELKNLLFDSAMGGVWIALMRFNLVPCRCKTCIRPGDLAPRNASGRCAR